MADISVLTFMPASTPVGKEVIPSSTSTAITNMMSVAELSNDVYTFI